MVGSDKRHRPVARCEALVGREPHRDLTNATVGVPALWLVVPDRVSPRIPLVVRPESHPTVLCRCEPHVVLLDAQEALRWRGVRTTTHWNS